jgi:hypothetical protein
VVEPLPSGFDGVAKRPIEPGKTIMTSKDKIARRKLSLLELASELSNVSRACKVMGYSRQQFYEIRRNFQTYGAEGLVDRAQLYVGASQTWNFDGDLRSRWLNPSAHLQLKGQTYVNVGAQHGQERFDGTLFRRLTSGWVNIESMYSDKLSAGVHANGGDAIRREFGNAQQGRSLGGGVWGSIRPTARLEVEPSLSYQRMNDGSGEELFAGYVTRTRVSYQFTRELFARTVVQYNDFNDSVSIEPLVMYRLNPLSILYLGSSHGYSAFEAPHGFERTERQFFLKIQYLFRP